MISAPAPRAALLQECLEPLLDGYINLQLDWLKIGSSDHTEGGPTYTVAVTATFCSTTSMNLDYSTLGFPRDGTMSLSLATHNDGAWRS